MTSLTIRSLRKAYGALTVLHGVDLDIRTGEFVVFVGPSGCGKSTLLRMIAGLEEITSGEIAIDGRVVNDMAPAERGIAMVFQSYALYPHMTVRENMSFGLKTAKMPKAVIEKRVNEAAEMLQVTALLDRLPKQLSGGQRQRVAIGRAITRDPKVFLFDEPLSNLDAALRVATRIEIARLKQRMPGATMIYVTHDQVEAMTLADRIVVMNGGRVEQVGTPMELYYRPANKFVAGFIGSPAMNFVEAEVVRNGSEIRIKTPSGDPLPPPLVPKAGDAVTIGIRPENLTLAEGANALLRGTVTVAENLGELITAYVDTGRGEPVIVKLPGDMDIHIGQTIALSAQPARLHLFNREGLRQQS
ncbi:MAG: sn-glycerol-3-phosphate ABC transporter ATP-binding protein UgpC [Rhizobiaceae bacterium]|nr:sn-glycerol-3-phosphate ABC transporter ATP-binding protein UgpC [Rhizobiaceae bacterium]